MFSLKATGRIRADGYGTRIDAETADQERTFATDGH